MQPVTAVASLAAHFLRETLPCCCCCCCVLPFQSHRAGRSSSSSRRGSMSVSKNWCRLYWAPALNQHTSSPPAAHAIQNIRVSSTIKWIQNIYLLMCADSLTDHSSTRVWRIKSELWTLFDQRWEVSCQIQFVFVHLC